MWAEGAGTGEFNAALTDEAIGFGCDVHELRAGDAHATRAMERQSAKLNACSGERVACADRYVGIRDGTV